MQEISLKHELSSLSQAIRINALNNWEASVNEHLADLQAGIQELIQCRSPDRIGAARDFLVAELVNAIRAAYTGKPTLAPKAAQALIAATRIPAETPGFGLTEREREILSLMVQGLSNQQIAEKLIIGLSTAKFHVSILLSKWSVASRTEAVSIALQHHLVKRPD